MSTAGVETTTDRQVTLDLRGIGCPLVLAAIVRELERDPDADVVVTTDHATSINSTIPTYCRNNGYDLEVLWAQGPVHRLRIRKR